MATRDDDHQGRTLHNAPPGRPALTEAGLAAKAAREARSAAALRENLRRRKAQARTRAASPRSDESPAGG